MTDTQAVANGEDLYVDCVGGNAAYDTDVRVEVAFGSDIIFTTHGDSQQDIKTHYTGDGVKTLTIKLINDTSAAETVGAFYLGDLT